MRTFFFGSDTAISSSSLGGEAMVSSTRVLETSGAVQVARPTEKVLSASDSVHSADSESLALIAAAGIEACTLALLRFGYTYPVD